MILWTRFDLRELLGIDVAGPEAYYMFVPDAGDAEQLSPGSTQRPPYRLAAFSTPVYLLTVPKTAVSDRRYEA